MKVARSHRQTVFGPLQRKTFRATLAAELAQHIPSLGSLTSQALADHLDHLIQEHFPPTQHLRMGQVLWPAVARDETGAYGKTIEQTRIQPVLLSLFTAEDLEDYLQGMSRTKLRQKVALRLFHQAYEQDGVLTRADVAVLMGLDTSTISKYVQEYERESQKTVPRRGTVHDLGPSVTHKRQICYQVVVQGRSIEDTARDTHHSPEAVTRYVSAYRRVFHSLHNGLSINDTAFVAKLPKRLVQEYADIQREHEQPREPAT